MRNASGHHGENERQQKKRSRTSTTFLHKCLTRKFMEVSRCSRSKQRQRNVQKSVLFCCFFAIRPTVVFPPFSLPSPLSITRFYILFEQTINIIESFAFSPG